jgi:hypothetical protein
MPFMPKAGTTATTPPPAPASPKISGMSRSALPASDHPLAPWLNWLDQRLRRALGVMRATVGAEAMRDAYRGLYVTPDDVDHLLAQPSGWPLFGGLNTTGFCDAPLPQAFNRMALATGLTPFDMAAVLIAVAPELDLRYERVFSFLQDDVNRKRPSVDLVLNLLCADTDEKLRMRSRFVQPAPLLRYGLLQLLPDAGPAAPALAIHGLKPDPQVVAAWLDETHFDVVLSACSRLHGAAQPADVPLQENEGATHALDALARLAMQAMGGAAPLRCYLHCDDSLALQAAANALANRIARPVLHLDLALLKDLAAAAAPQEKTFANTLGAAFRHAWAHDAFLCFSEADALYGADSVAELRVLLGTLNHPLAICLLTGAQPRSFGDAPKDLFSLAWPALTRRDRQNAWQHQLDQHGLPVDAAPTLASRFQLSTAHTRDAVRTTANERRLELQCGGPARTLTDMLFASARMQTRHVFAGLAQLIEPRRSWDDLILPADALAQLHEISSRFLRQDQVLNDWGFAARLGYGTGTTVLFAGPSGTGKTMAAEVLAHALELDLYRIDLAAIVSKYIGETEKNLDRLFNAADQANAVLFFDEADALFGKRTEVKDSHDRYANLEISYLLQKMEQYQGIAILASNLRQNLDEAFVRRLAFIVHFPFPDEAQRRRIWQAVWPAGMVLAEDLNLDELARELKLSGGNIKNVALAAAFLTAGEGGAVGREHIWRAAEREFQKLGRPNPMTKTEKAT